MSILKGFFDNSRELSSDEEMSKSEYFSFSKSISKAKNDLHFSKNGFSPKIALEEQLLLKSF